MSIKRVAILIFLCGLAYNGIAQLKLGIKVAPGLTPLRTTFLSDTMTVNEENSPLRMLAGLVIDYKLDDNYEFRSGLNFLSKKFSYNVSGDTPGVSYADDLIIQYIQIPVSLKLLTNEVALDSKVYMQLGGIFDIKVHDKIGELTDPLVTKAGFADIGLLVSAGLERRLGTETSAFAGFTYQRSFINQASETIALDENFRIQSTFIGLEIGVIF